MARLTGKAKTRALNKYRYRVKKLMEIEKKIDENLTPAENLKVLKNYDKYSTAKDDFNVLKKFGVEDGTKLFSGAANGEEMIDSLTGDSFKVIITEDGVFALRDGQLHEATISLDGSLIVDYGNFVGYED